MYINSIANYAPLPLLFTRLNSGETHFYSFEVAETQKQWMGYQPLSSLCYLCHFTDQRLIFELQPSLSYSEEMTSVLQTISDAVEPVAGQDSRQQKQSAGDNHGTTTATVLQRVGQAFQLSYDAIATFKVARTLSGAYAKIVLQPTVTEHKAVILAVYNPRKETKPHNGAGDFVQLGRELLPNQGEDSNHMLSFQFNPQAVTQFRQEVQSSSIPVLVDFWAPGCQPCEMMKPIVDEIATQFDGKIKLIKINVEENPSVPMHHNIDCFPTILLFKAGAIVEQVSGTVPGKLLTKVLNRHLAG